MLHFSLEKHFSFVVQLSVLKQGTNKVDLTCK